MNTSATPEWLEDNGGKPTEATTSSDDPNVEESDEKQKTSRCACCSCGCICVNLMSFVLCALFVSAAILQTNDDEPLQWIIYYSFNAIIPAMFLVYYMWCFPVLAIYFLSLVTAAWSIVYIIMNAISIKEWPKGEELDENVIYDIAGASVCLLSSLYHPIVAKCCVKKDDREKVNKAMEEFNEVTAEQV